MYAPPNWVRLYAPPHPTVYFLVIWYEWYIFMNRYMKIEEKEEVQPYYRLQPRDKSDRYFSILGFFLVNNMLTAFPPVKKPF